MKIIEKSMKNPRSALCKTAIMTSADIFRSFGHLLMSMSDQTMVLDNLLLQLLLKASQDKRFVCEEAAKVLEKMAESIPRLPLVNKLQPYVSHSNLRVRAKAGTAISKIVSNMSYIEMKDFGIPNLLQIAAELLNDRLLEAREAARSIICSIYREISQVTDTKEDNGDGAAVAVLWRDLCASILPPNRAHSVEKIVFL
ncbi:hypothetical protein HPP92_011555 [Vanilla planifolia]|uniref:TOG domain-containing protein n=1 Tax=Vanilla planifolia TaxID=51239 RepID=A0A835R0W8_VANPL|nr:hypothetical protein HPP92_011555 [Vanilla planifolia]